MNPAKFWFNFISSPRKTIDDLAYAPLTSTLTEDENASKWIVPQGIGNTQKRIKHNIDILNNRAINRGKAQAKLDIIRNLQSLGVPYYSAYIAADAATQGNYSYYQKLLSKYSSNTNDTNANSTSEGKLGLPISGMYDESAVNTETNANSDANKPLPPMSADEGEIPSGKVEVGPDTEVLAQPVAKPNVGSVVKSLRRTPKPKSYAEPAVINNTPVATTLNVPTPNVAAPTLSSVTTQAVRHNGGFDDYRRQSVLSALRAAGGISPAEAVQRGIIPWEALNYI